MTSIPVLTKEYLRSLSPLAKKISEDVDAAQDAYQDLWDTLGYKEQQQVLDEAIIDPAVVLKYAAYAHQNDLVWNDDFKSNFSWFTKSQLNLFTNPSLKNEKPKKIESFSPVAIKTSMVETTTIENNKVKSHLDPNNLLIKLKNKVSNLKNSSTPEEKKNLVDNKVHINIISKGSISKPNSPPPPPPSKYSGSEQTEKSALLSAESESDLGDEIPKTGFDFLDNW